MLQYYYEVENIAIDSLVVLFLSSYSDTINCYKCKMLYNL